MRRVLGPRFFDRPAPRVARALLGTYLVARPEGHEVALPITEAEAYEGFGDRASHASRGPTPRNRPMFGPPGVWYVYLVYGLHWMLNVVTGPRGHPAAVLLRGAGDAVGPGRLTRSLSIDGRLNARPASRATGLWIEDRGLGIPARRVRRGPRVGVAYAGEPWTSKPWRFLVTPPGDPLSEGPSRRGRAR